MNYDAFKQMSNTKQLELIREALASACNPADVFGTINPKRAYQTLIKRVHPDHNNGDSLLAEEITRTLNALWDDHENGAVVDATSFEVGGETFTLRQLLYTDPLGDVYAAECDDLRTLLARIAHTSMDDDLMQRESVALTDLNEQLGFDEAIRYIPLLRHALHGPDGRAVHIMEIHDAHQDAAKLVRLSDVASSYDYAIPAQHIGWIWRRVLAGLSHAHYYGYIHGGITPDSILIEPENHGAILMDWSHSSKAQRVIDTMIDAWESVYPPEIPAKKPPLPSTDIYMAAKSMMVVSKAMPQAMRRYFDWCADPVQAHRPNSIELLFREWDRVMYEHLGWKREFVVMDYAPERVNWGWWQS